jgi:hypothetical protein
MVHRKSQNMNNNKKVACHIFLPATLDDVKELDRIIIIKLK